MTASARTPLRVGLHLLFLAAGGLLCAGCGGGHQRGAPTPAPTVASETTTSTSVAAPRTTQPAATDPAVRGPIDDLLHAWDSLMTEAYRDPAGMVDHPDDPRRAPLRDAFTPDSPFAADFDALIRPFADNGWRDRVGPSGRGQQSELLDITLTPDADHLSFTWCSFNDGVTVRAADGGLVNDEVELLDGMGTAVRMDGTWRIYRLRQLQGGQQPARTANLCPARAAEAAVGR